MREEESNTRLLRLMQNVYLRDTILTIRWYCETSGSIYYYCGLNAQSQIYGQPIKDKYNTIETSIYGNSDSYSYIQLSNVGVKFTLTLTVRVITPNGAYWDYAGSITFAVGEYCVYGRYLYCTAGSFLIPSFPDNTWIYYFYNSDNIFCRCDIYHSGAYHSSCQLCIWHSKSDIPTPTPRPVPTPTPVPNITRADADKSVFPSSKPNAQYNTSSLSAFAITGIVVGSGIAIVIIIYVIDKRLHINGLHANKSHVVCDSKKENIELDIISPIKN